MDRHHSKSTVLILFVTMMGFIGAGFFLPFGHWGLIGAVARILLFLICSVMLYWFHFGDGDFSQFFSASYEEIEDDETVVFEAGEAEEESVWKGFGPAFNIFYGQVLKLVQQSLVAPQVGLYLIQNGKLVFQAGLSDEQSITQRFVVPESDLVYKIAANNEIIIKPMFSEGDVIAGFEEMAMQSFIGVPLIVGNECRGVLVAMSATPGHFGENDTDLLQRFAILTGHGMTVCHRGLHWEMDQEVYKVHIQLEQALEQCQDRQTLYQVFVDHVKQLFPMDRFTICLEQGGQGFIEFVSGQVDQLNPGVQFPLDGGLNGWLIKRNAPLIVQDIEDGRYIRPRYYGDEDSKHGMHSFLGIPLNGGRDEAWGCISLESKRSNEYGAKAKDVLTILALPMQLAFERLPKHSAPAESIE